MMFPGSVTGDSSLLNPETPSKSLLGATDNSIMFSPLSVSKVSDLNNLVIIIILMMNYFRLTDRELARPWPPSGPPPPRCPR